MSQAEGVSEAFSRGSNGWAVVSPPPEMRVGFESMVIVISVQLFVLLFGITIATRLGIQLCVVREGRATAAIHSL